MMNDTTGDADFSDGQMTVDGNRSCSARFEVHSIFADGFESGNTTGWSVAVQ